MPAPKRLRGGWEAQRRTGWADHSAAKSGLFIVSSPISSASRGSSGYRPAISRRSATVSRAYVEIVEGTVRGRTTTPVTPR